MRYVSYILKLEGKKSFKNYYYHFSFFSVIACVLCIMLSYASMSMCAFEAVHIAQMCTFGESACVYVCTYVMLSHDM